MRDLKTPREVRHALVYVLNNHRKHGVDRDWRLDPCASARWFPGWVSTIERSDTAPVVTPRTWLARWGWRRHGLLHFEEIPGAG